MSAAPASLVCRELRLRQFRNFAELDLEFPAAGVAIIGDNGAGKTNLLEAVYFLEIFRSFRGAHDEQLIRFGAEAFHIRGRFEDPSTGEQLEVTAAFERRGRRKRVTVNGAEPERLGDALGRIGVVVFSPSDVAIVAGAPAERRRFLDIVLSLNSPGYLAALQRYRHVLRQRNAALKAGRDPSVIAAWSEGLVEHGVRIIAARSAWIAAHAGGFAARCETIAGGAPVRMRYLCAAAPAAECGAQDGAAVAESFRRELARLQAREFDRGTTLVGPHRDDVGLLVPRDGAEVDLRDYGSGGQQRTAAIALRMEEAQTVRAARGREPIVLLDDVFAELDPGRSRRILELLEAEERGQALLTAPKASDIELRGGSLGHWRIADGRVFT